jgi:dipeptidyl aminopeptidase/acylaminoacyl peptidase
MRSGVAAVCVILPLLSLAQRGGPQREPSQTGTPSPTARAPLLQRRLVHLPADDARRLNGVVQHVDVEAITYLSDGLRINGYLALPNGAGPFPCIIVNRGGSHRLNVLDDVSAVEWLGRVASWGYAVIGSQYRGGGGSQGHDDYGGDDVDDVLNLIPVLETLPSADVRRIGMWGASRGGMMTYLALTRTVRVKAAVIVSGMSDLFESGRSRPEMEANFKEFMPDYDADRAAALNRRSAIRWIDKLPATVPFLIVHGTADWRVSPSQAFDMARALYEARRPMRLVMFEGGSHGVPEFAEEKNTLIRSWFDGYVRDGRNWPDLKAHGG